MFEYDSILSPPPPNLPYRARSCSVIETFAMVFLRCASAVPGACRWAKWALTVRPARRIRSATTSRRRTRGRRSANRPRRPPGSRSPGSPEAFRPAAREVGRKVAKEASRPADTVPTCRWTAPVSLKQIKLLYNTIFTGCPIWIYADRCLPCW